MIGLNIKTVFYFYFKLFYYLGIVFCLYSDDAYIYNCSNEYFLPSSYNCKDGTKIGMEINMNEKTLFFFHNGMLFNIFYFN
jgi:hypothetical protein